MKDKLLLIIAGAVFLAIPGYFIVSDVVDRSRVKAIASKKLNDAGSAQWRDVKARPDGSGCGEVNAKNLYGAYVGFKRFEVDQSGIVTFEGSSAIPYFPSC